MPQANGSPKPQRYLKYLRLLLVILFMGGFVYQTFQFLFLYWTYPTVVDIQQSSPSYLEVPAFSFCNRVGYNYSNICNKFKVRGACANALFSKMASSILCGQYPFMCMNNSLPEGFTAVMYGKFMEKYSIQVQDIPHIAVPLENYLNCTIEFAGQTTQCNLENVLGSFYTTDDLPQFCYTIYSIWGQPGKKRSKIPKGSSRAPDEEGEYPLPFYNPPSDPAVQVAVHSPYFLPSPYFAGSSFLGGRAYELRIKLSESHLLAQPYQTNCTDYMKVWYERGGKAPINQLNIIQECRINKTFEALGCIPVTMDYPHKYPLCTTCPRVGPCNLTEPPNDCVSLADSYNQACFSMNYIVDKEDKVITKFMRLKHMFSTHPSDGFRISKPSHDCEGRKMWRPECSTVEIDIPFDRFEITNITYNAKYESLELFSVIGGYMGMWLGISLLAVYDIIVEYLLWIRKLIMKRNRKRSLQRKTKLSQRRNDNFMEQSKFSAPYSAW